MNGLYLQGGGAKGAFQAGALYELNKQGIRFEKGAGTSIGAVNLYFLLTGNLEAMKERWTHVDLNRFDHDFTRLGKVLDNEPLMAVLEALEVREESLREAWVNHTAVEDGKLREKRTDLKPLSKTERMAAVKASALLPLDPAAGGIRGEVIEGFNSEKLFERFRKRVSEGLYDGCRLDGGILNNFFVEPFIEEPLEGLVLIVFEPAFDPGQVLKALYGRRLLVIGPEVPFKPSDTLRFEEAFCRRLFYEGQRAVRGKGRLLERFFPKAKPGPTSSGGGVRDRTGRPSWERE